MSDPQSAAAVNKKISVALIAPQAGRRGEIAWAIRETRARVAQELSAYPDTETLTKLVQSDCDVIIVDLDSGVLSGVDLIAAICARNAALTVMACSSQCEADVVVQCMRAGAREFLTQPLSVAAVEEALMRATIRRQTVAPERHGKILVFQGAKGGVGTTTLAINFAVALSEECAGTVALVDLHPQLGEIALGLGIAPQFSITDAMDNSPRLDADLLSTLLMKHDSGLMVLASPDVYGTRRYRTDDIEQLLGFLREKFEFVVVDAGPCSENTPDALFGITDTIYVVTEINLPALRNARRMITWLADKASPRGVEIVLNRFNSREVEIGEESAATALSRPVDWRIPNDYAAVRAAQNLGRPLVTQDTPVSRAVRRMARAACGKPAVVAVDRKLSALKGDKWKFWISRGLRQPFIVRS